MTEYEPYVPGGAATPSGGRATEQAQECTCTPCGACDACERGERCERCTCGAADAPTPGSTYAPYEPPATTSSQARRTSSTPRRSYSSSSSSSSSSTRRRRHSSYSSSLSSSRSSSKSKGKSKAAAGVCGLAACGGGIASTQAGDDPSRQDKYDQCVTEFLQDHPRESSSRFDSSTYGSDPFSSTYLDKDYGYSYDEDSGSYEGTFRTPKSACEYLLD